jgi:shikimate dehydrogenase
VADLVYHPVETALLAAARAVGATPVDGLGMLVHQAALQQQIWLGSLPDIGVMRAAALRELAARSR